MNLRTRLLIGTVAIACCSVGIALATPIVGLNFANILATSTINAEVLDRAKVELPPVLGQEKEEDNDWNVKLTTGGPSNFIVQDVSYFHGGHTGWHSHSGILLTNRPLHMLSLSVLTELELTTRKNCNTHSRWAGQNTCLSTLISVSF